MKKFIMLTLVVSLSACGVASSSPTAAVASPTSRKIGDPVDVGNFSYVVNNAKFLKEVGGELDRKKADGVFLVINVTFRNNDKEEHTLDNSLFKLTDDKGTEFESSSDGES
ncbi:MAG TPA: DUF4352 domain-containing protein, partial [Dinghuibacter sp.]|uniref:DUF4352 domain-containing protein n=1 Tax=Dinghuibacter sp. TaxID=2024697 RepID=UPI002BA0B497